jgi:hypothetical protein
VPNRWCTVTVTDAAGKRHSLDVLASSTYDAAHLYVVHAKAEPRGRLPLPALTLVTVFEVVANDRVYHISGSALQQWIEHRRQTWNGPKGALFRRRPGLRET